MSGIYGKFLPLKVFEERELNDPVKMSLKTLKGRSARSFQ
jgi:hypothetical protein